MAFVDDQRAATRRRPATNGLSGRRVTEIQRSRILAAALAAVEDVGYQRMTVAQVIARARVSRKTFYPDHEVIGERELRRRERLLDRPLASTQLARRVEGRVHRPDLVLLPPAGEQLPVAVEVELTPKAPRRLVEICRAWGFSRDVAGVLYLAPAGVRRGLDRAIALSGAERIVVLPLDSLALLDDPGAAIARVVSSEAYVAPRGSTIEQTECTCPASRSTE